MKKVGTITESRMTKPAEPKSYPLVSDSLFGGKVKIEENAAKGYPKKGVKGGTKAAAKIAKAKKVGNAKLLKDADGVLSTNQTKTAITKGGASMGGYKSQRGNTEDEDNEKVGGQMTDAFETGSSDTEGASGNVGPDTQKLADKTMDNAAQEKLKKQREEWLASRKKPGLQPGAKSVGNTTSSK
tara:strand:+ start:20 stop:571 length:552 start_codon:yes stop_codon:yes gene_type:complete